MLFSPEKARQIFEEGREMSSDFPVGANTYVLCRLLQQRGIYLPYHPNPAIIVPICLQAGANVIPIQAPPRIGDLFVCTIGEPSWLPFHVGIIIKLHRNKSGIVLPDYFLCADEYMEPPEYRPYPRPFSGDEKEFLPVSYYLRWT